MAPDSRQRLPRPSHRPPFRDAHHSLAGCRRPFLRRTFVWRATRSAYASRKIKSKALHVSPLLAIGRCRMKFFSGTGLDQFLFENFFRGKRNGVFVDAGAKDGETSSNSLFFERFMDWRG